MTSLQSNNDHHWPMVKRIQGEKSVYIEAQDVAAGDFGYIQTCEVQVNNCSDPWQKHGGFSIPAVCLIVIIAPINSSVSTCLIEVDCIQLQFTVEPRCCFLQYVNFTAVFSLKLTHILDICLCLLSG